MSPYNYLVDRYKRGGISHLYRGYLPRVLGVIPMRSMFWGAQSTTYSYLHPHIANENIRVTLAGIAGGTAQTLVDNPIEVIKTRQITSSHMQSKSMIPIPFKPNSSNLPRFPGFIPTLSRNIGFMVVLTQFTTIDDHDSYLCKFGLAGVGGFVGSVLTQPIDYIKTRMQSANYDGKSALRILSETVRKDPRILMVGTMPRATLGFVNMGVGYLGFTLFINVFKRL